MNEDSSLYKLYISRDLADYLLSEIVYERKNIVDKYCPKDSKEYTISKAIVYPLRKIYRYIKK